MRGPAARVDARALAGALLLGSVTAVLRVALSSSLLVLFGHALAAETAASGSVPGPQPIRSVWTTTQACNGLVVENMKRSPDEARIRGAGAVDLGQFGVRFVIPHVPQVDAFSLKIVLGDRSRGVVDNYVLISDQDLKAPFGALVVTELPPAIKTVDAAFGAVAQLERGLAQSAWPAVQGRDIADARLGRGVEYLTPNRVGSACFPTSAYKFVPPGAGVRTLGVSRFFVRGQLLIEMAVVVSLPESIPPSAENDYARAEMDRYVAGLTLSDPAR